LPILFVYLRFLFESLKLEPKSFMADCEVAALNSFSASFAGCEKKICFFHWGQALFKHFVLYGLRQEYLENEPVELWFKRVFTIALLPSSTATVVFDGLVLELNQLSVGNATLRTGGAKFVKYFRDNYLKPGCDYPPALWNHFKTDGERTNNRIEADNRKMNGYCGAANPDIEKAVSQLQLHESSCKLKYNNSKKSTAHQPAQKDLDNTRDIKFKEARRYFHAEKLSLQEYHQEVCRIHSFEPKKKYIERAVDTDTSDEDINDTEEAEAARRLATSQLVEEIFHNAAIRRDNMRAPLLRIAN
jgi:hypothetical protein